MSRRDVDRRFDEIVEFAGLERFLDTPLKRYSWGMYLRLAFAVAAHVEPDIVIVDEVLAIGDARFRREVPRARCPSSGRRAERSSSSATTSARSRSSAGGRSGSTTGQIQADGAERGDRAAVRARGRSATFRAPTSRRIETQRVQVLAADIADEAAGHSTTPSAGSR